MRVLSRGARRGCRRARRRHPPAAAADRVSHRLHPAARPRPAPRGGKEPSDGHRPDRPAPARVPLRRALQRDHAPRPRADRDAGARGLPVPAGRLHRGPRQASEEIVLENLRAAVQRSRWQTLVSDLRAHREVATLGEFLDATGHRLVDVYKQGRSWTQLQRDAGREVDGPARSRVRGAVPESDRPAHARRRSRAGRASTASCSQAPRPPTLEQLGRAPGAARDDARVGP